MMAGRRWLIALSLAMTSLPGVAVPAPATDDVTIKSEKPVIRPVCGDGTHLVRAAAADLSGDGIDELVVTCERAAAAFRGGRLEIHTVGSVGSGDAGLVKVVEFEKEPRAITVGDRDGDNRSDLVVTLHGSHERALAILRGRSDGWVGAPEIVSLGGSPAEPTVLNDLDEDGDTDLLQPAEQVVYYDQGAETDAAAGRFRAAELPAGTRSRYDIGIVADLNGDGLDDAAWTRYRHGKVLVALGGGSGYQEIMLLKRVRLAVGLYGGGDFNDDGLLDLVVASQKAPQERAVRLALSEDPEFWGLGPEVEEAGDPRQLVVADVTGDGIEDLVASPRGKQRGLFNAFYVDVLPGVDRAAGLFGRKRRLPLASFPSEIALGRFSPGDGMGIAVVERDENRALVFPIALEGS